MSDKYILWTKMDEKGNSPDESAGYRIINKENAIAFLGLCGYENPEYMLKTYVDASGGLININDKALYEVREVTYEEMWKSLKTIISIESHRAKDNQNMIKYGILKEVLHEIDRTEIEKNWYDELLKEE